MTKVLEELLDAVHTCVLTGKFHDLADLASKLEMEISGPDLRNKFDFQRLRVKSKRNETCILAAINGMGAAALRIQEIRKAALGLTTYGKDGRSSTLANHARPAKRF